MSSDRPRRLYGWLLAYLAGSTTRLLLIACALLTHALALLALPWLIQWLVHDAVVLQAWGGIAGALGLLLALQLLISLTRYVGDDQLEHVSLHLLERIRKDVHAKLLRTSIPRHSQRRSGDPISLIFNDVQVLKAFLRSACFSIGSDLLSLVGAVGMMFMLSWRLAALASLAALLGGALIVLTSSWTRRRFHRVQVALAELTCVLTEQVQALPTIQALGTDAHERQRFATLCQRYSREALWGARCHALSQLGLNTLVALVLAVLLHVGVQDAAAEDMPLGAALERTVGFALYAVVLIGPLNRVGRTNSDIQQMLAAARHLATFLDLPEEQADGQALTAPPRGLLTFAEVGFAYRPDQPVLAGFTLTIQPGETVALVGRSGAGKSTVANLLLRFYDPDAGSITLDGHDLRALRRHELRRQIGWAGQDPVVFSGSIADNIAYGNGPVTRAAVEHAAELACAADFIRTLPHGYDTHVGERGLDLSGGQRARLALARVVLRAPAVVILDEATAALDAQTEARLWTNLAAWLAERTTLIVAHRLATVLLRPRIVVLDGGRVVGDGPAHVLRQTCPAFHALFRQQMRLDAAA